jgi:hypothetical protein
MLFEIAKKIILLVEFCAFCQGWSFRMNESILHQKYVFFMKENSFKMCTFHVNILMCDITKYDYLVSFISYHLFNIFLLLAM